MMDIADRIEMRSIPEPNSGCRLWLGSTTGFGYGTIMFKGKSRRIHRLAWECVHGSIPLGMCVLHKCDVPSCSNPAHLFLGTYRDNRVDAINKGRAKFPPNPKGRRHYKAKVTSDLVASIHRLRGSATQKEIAAQVGVAQSMVSKILAGKGWWVASCS